MKKIVNEIDIDNKRVIVRCDFNVPIKNGKILDSSKIDAATETINYLIEHNCKIILLSHLGKVRSEADKQKNTLKPVFEYLKTILKTNVYFYEKTRSLDLDNKVKGLNSREVLLIENTRHEDYPDKLESNNDIQLAMYWSNLGDIFVLDAFASAHRAHASTCGIAKFIPNCYGFLVAKEMANLDKYVNHPEHPFTIVMGGAKMDDKLALIKTLIKKCDFMLLGGALANTCLKVLGYDIGSSLASDKPEILKEVYKIVNEYKEKIILPTDAIIGRSYDANFVDYVTINELNIDDSINDIGVKTLNQYREIISNSTKTLFMNGTVGKYEDKRFANGTKELLEMIKNSPCTKVAGGGDALSAINTFGYQQCFNYLSTGGGATLEYIANGSLIALDVIAKEN